MATYILKRLGLALITLWLLSVIVFFATQVLPGDPGRAILGNLETMTGSGNQKKVQAVLDNIDLLVTNERPKIERITDQLAKVTGHADETIQNVNGTVTDLRDPMRKDLVELRATLEQANALLQSVQVIVRANDYKIDDTVENLREATDNLNQFTNSLKQRPWSLIRTKQPGDRQVPK